MSKNIWQEIKEQPPHIREIFMWVCVVAVFSVVGYSWFQSTTKQFVAMVNPDLARQNQTLAENQKAPTTPFGTLARSWQDLRANINELFNFADKPNSIQIENIVNVSPLPAVKPNLLPLPGKRK